MDFWATLIAWIVANWGTVLGALTSIVGGFALIAALTPNTSDDTIVSMILKAINFLGANVGKAKNDPAVKLLALVFFAVALSSGCASQGDSSPGERIGDFVEAACVKQQLSAEQADAMNALPAKKRPSYCLGQATEEGDDGDAWCDAEENDRIFAAHCSRAIRALFEGR